MRETGDFEMGYLAGIIEGEGCFYSSAWENPSGNTGLDISLQVGNDSPQLMMWLKTTFGGEVSPCGSGKTFVWILRGREHLLPLLKKLEGMLLFKEQQRATFVKLLESLQSPHQGIPLTAEENDRRILLHLEHKKLIRLTGEAKKGGREKGRVVMGLSGGLDSTTLLYYLRWLGYEVVTVSVDYGQRHATELERSKRIARLAEVENIQVDLTSLRGILPGSALTDPSVALPDEHYTHESQKLTVVPARNLIFISILASLALSRKMTHVAFGAHSSDYAIYPDCRAPFVEVTERAIWEGNYERVVLLAPFLALTKANIVFLAALLNVPMGDTWSCYAGGDVHCGRCGTCRERREAFHLAGIPDPTIYSKDAPAIDGVVSAS